jgi:hypothetical protein
MTLDSEDVRGRIRKWLSGTRLRLMLVALLAFGVLVLVLYVLPSLLVGPDSDLTTAERLKAENDVRTTLLQAVAGAVLLAGLYFTGRTYLLNREGQVTERFTRAIDQLGSKSLDVRLGGIYALERLAGESKRDHWPIIEVLTAFVRERAPWTESAEKQAKAQPTEAAPNGPELDVQAVLTVLVRRNRKDETEDQRILLRGSDLRKAVLTGPPSDAPISAPAIWRESA